MTVKQLIEQLSKARPDDIVLITSSSGVIDIPLVIERVFDDDKMPNTYIEAKEQ